MRRVLVAGLIASVGLGMSSPTAEARVVKPEVWKVSAACRYEDGYGQRSCYWNAGKQGNGQGASFVNIDGGRRWVYVPNRRMPKKIDKNHVLVVKIGRYNKKARNYAEVWYGRTLLVDDARVYSDN